MSDADPSSEASTSQGSQGSSSLASSRYRLNLLLFVVLVVGVTVWFRLHLEPLVTTTSLVGGTLTLWGLWKLFQEAFLGKAGKELSSWTQKLLGRASATEPLVFALVVLAFLYGLTSSLYFEYAGAKAGESSFEVEVWKDGNPWLEAVPVKSTKRVQGQPFFLALGPRTLEVRITDPPGFESETRTLWPWTSLRLEVPGDFERRRLRALRLVPGLSLQSLPDPGSEVTALCTLRLAVEGGAELLRLDDVREHPLLTGAPAEDLDQLAGQIDAAELESHLREHLTLVVEMPQLAQAPWLIKWRATPKLHPSPQAPTHEPLTLEIRCPNTDGTTRLQASWRTTLDALPGDKIKTWILEVGR